MKKVIPVVTRDGSLTLFNTEAGEHYHSVYGAIQESGHIFIGAGLDDFPYPGTELRILEIGLGTGLNALLSLEWAEKQRQKIFYLGVEAYPLAEEVYRSLNYTRFTGVSNELFLSLHNPRQRHAVSAFFEMETRFGKYQDFQPPKEYFHVIFFDAFSPESQPEMWTLEGFKKLYGALVRGGVLVTYSCKGTVKRALKGAGFQIEKLPGPPGKREFLRAVKP